MVGTWSSMSSIGRPSDLIEYNYRSKALHSLLFVLSLMFDMAVSQDTMVASFA
jgi:hypothetical protein